MRLFDLLGFQHVMAYIFIGLLFMVVFGIGLAYVHFHSPDDRRRKEGNYGSFLPKACPSETPPFPLVMVLIIVGVVIWGFVYTFAAWRLGE